MATTPISLGRQRGFDSPTKNPIPTFLFGTWKMTVAGSGHLQPMRWVQPSSLLRPDRFCSPVYLYSTKTMSMFTPATSCIYKHRSETMYAPVFENLTLSVPSSRLLSLVSALLFHRYPLTVPGFARAYKHRDRLDGNSDEGLPGALERPLKSVSFE